MTGSLYAGTGEGLPQCSADTRKRPDQQGCEGGAEERAPTPGGGALRDSVLGGGASGTVSWVDTLPSAGGWGAGGGARGAVHAGDERTAGQRAGGLDAGSARETYTDSRLVRGRLADC